MTSPRTGVRQVVLDGHGKVTLNQNNHVATGGEGSVYRLANVAIKIYTDPRKMQKNDMAGKIRALTVMQHKYIVAPRGLVLDQGGVTPIGLYMPFTEGEPYPRVFTNDYWNLTGFNDEKANVLTERMQEVVKYAHAHQATIVDGNELSWLLSMGNGPEPHIIDVDSWSIGHWPPTVIMPSIRDWHTKGYNELTDWFAWGIVSFQVYTGIHPYKGTLAGYKMGELERRMRDNASVFAKGVRLNRNVRDFSRIPAKLLQWYIATLQDGMREMPPSPFDVGIAIPQAAIVARTIITAAGKLMYKKLYDNSLDAAIRIFPCGVVLLESGRLYDLGMKRVIGTVKSRECEIVKAENSWLVADWDNNQLVFSVINNTNFQQEALTLPMNGHKLVTYENRLFVATDQGLTEIKLRLMPRPILAPAQTWGAMVQATRWFDGVGVMDAMGAMFLIAPFLDNAVAQIRVRELDGLRPVMGKAGNRFIALMMVDQHGQYQKLEFTFKRNYASYKVSKSASDSPELNMTILPRGVCASIVEDGELNIFAPTSDASNKVQNPSIACDMILGRWDNTVIYIRNGEIWSMRM